MLEGEHSAILSTFIKLPSSLRPLFFSIFEWPPKTGFTVGFIEHSGSVGSVRLGMEGLLV